MRYCVRRQSATALLTIGHRFDITDETGAVIYRVADRLQSAAATAAFRDSQGHLVLSIERWKLMLGLGYYIQQQGQTVGVVQVQQDLAADGPDPQMRAHGDDLDIVGDRARHEYMLLRRDHVVAHVSHRWCATRSPRTYGVDVLEGEDDPVLLACVVAVDMLFQYV